MSPKLARCPLFIDLLEITLRSRCTAKDLCYKNVRFIILEKLNADLMWIIGKYLSILIKWTMLITSALQIYAGKIDFNFCAGMLNRQAKF